VRIYFKILDMGFTFGIGIRVKKYRKAWLFNLPIPLRLKTIKYSLRNQGFLKSIQNLFIVP